MELFARIIKADARTRTVTGRAAAEEVDKDGEVFDYASSVPYFKAWSADCSAATSGLSLGNVRAMHGNVAAGVLKDIQFNDDEKAVDVVAKITDENEWNKIISGTYQGFSIGGRYAKKWSEVQDGRIVQRYTAIPSELSIVDRPCIGSAQFHQISKGGFMFTKRDGRVVKRAFAGQSMTKTQMADAVARGMQLVGALGGGIQVFKNIHRKGRKPLPGDFLHKYEPTAPSDRTEAGIRKMQAIVRANPSIDIAKVLKRARRRELEKVSFPPNSANGQWDNNHADTGATNDWRDHPAPTDKPVRIGGQVVGKPAQSNMDAVLAAIKQDLARGAKRVVM